VGRNKHCTKEKRNIIKSLTKDGKTYREIEKIVGCSSKMISNALKYKTKVETRGRKKVMTPRTIRRIISYSKKHLFASANLIKKELGIKTSLISIRRKLKNHNLNACHPRKVPLLKKIHAKKIKIRQRAFKLAY